MKRELKNFTKGETIKIWVKGEYQYGKVEEGGFDDRKILVRTAPLSKPTNLKYHRIEGHLVSNTSKDILAARVQTNKKSVLNSYNVRLEVNTSFGSNTVNYNGSIKVEAGSKNDAEKKALDEGEFSITVNNSKGNNMTYKGNWQKLINMKMTSSFSIKCSK